jgi:lipid-A-disaccharide synthase
VTEGPLIYIIAGEPSGDFLGGRLMASLKERTGGAARFAGIGGEDMGAEGLASRISLSELSVMGVAEILPRARAILGHVRATVAHIQGLKPDAVVTIDSSGFTWRIAHGLRRRGETLPLIHYVAPMVWAWRAGRARRMARWYDHLMALLPFEPPFFTAVGLSCSYVGHPVVESGADRGDGSSFRRRHNVAASTKLVVLLPGSRRGEVLRLLPVFKAAVERLAARYRDIAVALPTTDTVEAEIRAAVALWPMRVIVVRGKAEKYDAFAAGDVAVAASGTVALELALARLPTVIAYRVSPLTHALVRRIVRIGHAHLVNLLLKREVVPELLQEHCTPERLAAEATRLLDDRVAREAQVSSCGEALRMLGYGDLAPGLRAADEVLAIIAAHAPRGKE